MAHKKEHGYVLIMLLVVIAIGMIIYYMDISWMGGDSRMIKKEKPEDQPWKDEALIRGPNQPAKLSKKPAQGSTKPAITTTLALAGEVATKDAKRGQIAFTIDPNGTIVGTWQCQYSYTHSAYEITAVFKGNTDTTQNAPDDLSKLLVIAMGDFDQKATNLESDEVTETKGTLYVKGWLSKDFTASGTLSITTNKKWHADYNWTAK